MKTEANQTGEKGRRWPTALLAAVFLTIAAFFLMLEHRAHLFGALPWILLLICLAVIFAVLWIDRREERRAGDEIKRRLRTGQGGQSHDA